MAMTVQQMKTHAVSVKRLQPGDEIVTLFEPDGTPKQTRTLLGVSVAADVWCVSWREGGTCALADEKFYVIRRSQ